MAAHKYLRFAPPMALSLMGLIVAMWLVDLFASNLIVADPVAASSSLVWWLPGGVRADTRLLVTYTPLLTFAAYLIFGIPVSCVLALVTKVIRVTSYDIDIVKIGQDFGAARMLRRAAMPALFSLSVSGVLSGLLTGFLITPLDVNPIARPFYLPLESITMTLVVLPIVLAFFIPTWMLDDAGVVMHLKEKHLKARRCPEAEGVGRWWSNLQSGFTIIAVPLVAFFQNFYRPLLSGDVVGTPFLLRGLLVSVGIPFLAIAFTLPVIILNEILVGTAGSAVRRFVRSLGARDLELEMKLTQVRTGEEPVKQESMSRQDEDGTADGRPTSTG